MHNGARSKDAGRGERGAAARAAHRAAGEAGGGAGGGGPLVTVPGVQVRVPGSTSNVGAGFDCVGIAIERRLSATFRVDRALGAPVRVERRGTLQAVTVPSDRDWLFAGFVAACRGAGCKVPGGVMIDAASEIPIGRGLGSSGAATVAGALAARALLGLELDDAALARLCADVEHHPDNVAPAIYGGAVLAVPGPEGRVTVAPLEVHASRVFVFAVPEVEVATERARAALPPSVSHRTAATAAAKAGALLAGLARAAAGLLAAALDDVLHVPHRRALVPGYDAVTAAARATGAFGATLSGSGSSILAVTPASAAPGVADAMAHAWRALGVTVETFVLSRPAGRYQVTGLTQETVPCPSR